MVECTALEMRRALTGTVGSNPTLSATYLVSKPARRQEPLLRVLPFALCIAPDKADLFGAGAVCRGHQAGSRRRSVGCDGA